MIPNVKSIANACIYKEINYKTRIEKPNEQTEVGRLNRCQKSVFGR